MEITKEHVEFVLDENYQDVPAWIEALELCWQCIAISKFMVNSDLVYRMILTFGQILSILPHQTEEEIEVYQFLRDIGEEN